MSSEPIPVVDNTPPVPPAPAASLSDIKHDVEKLAPGSLVGYSGEENGENGRRPVNLARKLNARQITFIGFSGGIGTGLFIGAGAAYAKSGPAGLFLCVLSPSFGMASR